MTYQQISSEHVFTGSPLTTMSFIDPVKDLIDHEEFNTNSWFLVGRLEGDGHQFGFLTHLMRQQSICLVGNSLLDITTGWYRAEEKPYPREKVSVPRTGLDIHTPTATITGTFEEWSAHMIISDGGEATLTLRPVGGVLFNAGSASFPFFGEHVFHYALPTLETTGTVVANDGQTYHVSGVTWFDRQWQVFDQAYMDSLETGWRWTWFNLNLENGDHISVWDIVDSVKGTEQSFATALHPDGSQTVAPVVPVIQDASNFWVSPHSGHRYPSHWVVRIPALEAELEVTLQGPQNQEVPSPIVSRYEGACSVKGTYHGKPTTGHTYVEMVGAWK